MPELMRYLHKIKKNYFLIILVLFFALAIPSSFADTILGQIPAGNHSISGNPAKNPSIQEMVYNTWVAPTQKPDGAGLTAISSEGKTDKLTMPENMPGVENETASDDLPFWARLEALDTYDKINAVIQFESKDDVSESDIREIKNAENLWNTGVFDSAIEVIRSLETSGRVTALGISWKVPKNAVPPNWIINDIRIGAKTTIKDTSLDFDAQNGNLFAVMKYRNGSSTYWYWSVNISTDKGKTWQETYQWGATYEVKDIGAAVADDYLWVGYLSMANPDAAFMRRFAVSNGLYDSSHGLKTIFNKNKPIKEISIFSNADDYDNRVYCAAILDNTISPAPVEETTPLPTVTSQPAREPDIISLNDAPDLILNQLARHPKIKNGTSFLNSFQKEHTATRVIINLRDPERKYAGAVRQDFKSPDIRESVKQKVKTAINRVVYGMDPNEFIVTNRFIYIFGFSAEVTIKGLAALVNHPDVVSINEDGIRHPHLAQGIPLINAAAVRNNYNGSGMAIAICDTGVDYTHDKLGNGGFPNTKVIGGYDTGENDADPMDEQGHGTSCAGIAAGNPGTTGDYIGGVAYNAKIYAVKMSRTDINHSAYDSDMIEAWEWCVTHQYDDPTNPIMIISTSFGGGYYTTEAGCDTYSPAMTTAAANAKGAGMTLFVSTGNDGFCDGTGWPGGISHVVGVGAVYDADIGRNPDTGFVGCISTDSCVGYTIGCPCDSGNCYVDSTTAADQVTTYSSSASFMELFGPSNDTYTTKLGGGYRIDFGGTSAACPYAAGAAAVLQSAAKASNGFFMTPAQVQSTLISTGNPVTDPKAGITKPRVNLGNAVAAVVPDNLVFYWAINIGTATPVWIENATGIKNALKGLDATWNPGYAAYFSYCSYIASKGSDNPVMVLRQSDSAMEAVQIFPHYTGASRPTSVSAYKETVICAYENHPGTYYSIRYNISYNGGNTWSYAEWNSDSTSYFSPDITCRGGKGSAIIFQEEAGDFDPVWFKYRDHYSSGPWSDSIQVNQIDCLTGSLTTIQWLPPMQGDTYSYGSIYLSNGSLPYFNRNDGGVLLPIGAVKLLLLDD